MAFSRDKTRAINVRLYSGSIRARPNRSVLIDVVHRYAVAYIYLLYEGEDQLQTNYYGRKVPKPMYLHI
jgi:hypothetical protein